MTFGLAHVVGVSTGKTRRGFFGTEQPLFGRDWREVKLLPMVAGSWTLQDVWVFAVGAHLAHLLEFCVAMVCYWLFYLDGSWQVCRWIRMGLRGGFESVCAVVVPLFKHEVARATWDTRTTIGGGVGGLAGCGLGGWWSCVAPAWNGIVLWKEEGK